MGCSIPPPHEYKQKTIIEYGKNITNFVESGTYLGEMIKAQLPFFKRIVSIELDEALYMKNVEKFRGNPNVLLLKGDSGLLMQKAIDLLVGRKLFWLDGHYSGGNTAKGDKECPVLEELDTILRLPEDNIILIDDARCFNGQHSYPTIEELKSFISAKNDKYNIEIKHDIIRLTAF